MARRTSSRPGIPEEFGLEWTAVRADSLDPSRAISRRGTSHVPQTVQGDRPHGGRPRRGPLDGDRHDDGVQHPVRLYAPGAMLEQYAPARTGTPQLSGRKECLPERG